MEKSNKANKAKLRKKSFQEKEMKEKVISINRVAKVVKGGRIFRFRALVVIGDGKGNIGYATGKAAEIVDAIRKGVEKAKKSMVHVLLDGTTIPHEIIGKHGAGMVLLKPAIEGTGIIAGGPARAVIELCGIKNIRIKCLKSNNPKNVVMATVNALSSLMDRNLVYAHRGIRNVYAGT